MTSNWMVYVIEGGSGHCHEAGLTVLISIILQVRETVAIRARG